MTDGPRLIDIPLWGDDRGFVHCIMDQVPDWKIKRIYAVENYARGQIRAWHGHKKGATFIHVISGAAKVAAMKIESPYDLESHVISARKPQGLLVPPGYYNGHMSLEDHTILLVLSTLTFGEVQSDDERAPHYFQVTEDFWSVKNR